MERKIYVRHVNDEDEVEEEDVHHQPLGCMWGFMHALDYHHRHQNLKIIPQGPKHAKGKINPKTSSLVLDNSDELKHLLEDTRNSHSLVNDHKTRNKSMKARIKALISEAASKQEKNGKKQKSGHSPTSKLQRTHSIHYLQPYDQSVTVSRNNTLQEQFKEDTDWSLKVGTGNSFHTPHNSGTKARLTKSGTFPTADCSQTGNLKFNKLDHKKKEIWFSLEDRHPDNAQLLGLALPKYKMNYWARSWTLSYTTEFNIGDQKSWLISHKAKPGRKEQRNTDGMDMPMKETNHSVVHEAVGDGFCTVEKDSERRNEELLNGIDDGPDEAYQADWPGENVENHLFTGGNTKDGKNQETLLWTADDISMPQSGNEIVSEIFEKDATETMRDAVNSRSNMENKDSGELDENTERSNYRTQNRDISDRNVDVNNSNSSSLKVSQPSTISDYASSLLEQSENPATSSLLKDLEDYFQQLLECSKEDCSHQLLYDLINEEIVWICDRPFRLYRKALLSSSGMYPLPLQNDILDKIYVNISKSLTRKPKRYQRLDDLVSEDLDKDVNWIDLGSQSDYVALELENVILDELLEELICP